MTSCNAYQWEKKIKLYRQQLNIFQSFIWVQLENKGAQHN